MIGRDALVGMNSVIMDGAVIGEESIVAAMSFVKAGFRGEKRQLLIGTPDRAVRCVIDDELHWKRLNTKEYQDLVGRYHASLHETQPLRQMEENRPRLQGTTDERQLLMGTPARAVRSVSDDELHWKRLNTKEYQDLVGRCHASLHETQPLRQMEENRPRLQGTTDVTPKR